MANSKPSFAKMKLAKDTSVKTINFNDFEIEVKQYLPVNDKLGIISRVANYASEEDNYSNPVKEDIFGTLEILYEYTNISFTDKQKEDPAGLYDIVISSGLADAVIAAIPEAEYKSLVDGINKCINAIYTYRNSMMGILDIVKTDYSDLDLDTNEIYDKIADKDNLSVVRDVLTKLG